jgi:hypothetical protein
LGGGSDLAPSQKQRQFPSPRCCLMPIRLFMRLRRRSCGSGRRLRPSTNASVTRAPSWRSAPRRRPCQFASERSELERDSKDYKNDLQKVYARELEASRKEKRLAKRVEALN